ncbi:OLC1v1025483C1 [Oldenlandia corymbosa var. corymbosa]|uniref:OLC1v1025483C1 n=1 Tax=Oldenlandia corymbosa var. corymbosa TaxID=529605 RepID=A0AAV1C5S5_OLDCO|nr:OLC1v1025483C1 [Oldenlandia corymbosa var. corymbosa]
MEKFGLRWMNECQAVYANKWISHTIACNVKVLNLKVRFPAKARDFGDSLVHLPGTLFTCEKLEFLRFYDNESFPETEELKIHAPALEDLRLTDNVSRKFSLEGLTSLRDVSLDLCHTKRYEQANYGNIVVKQVQAMDCVKVLTLSYRTTVALNSATTKLAGGFENLTKLYIQIYCCRWSVLKDLLGCFMKLELLDIKKILCANSEHRACWSEPTNVPKCMVHSLVHVSLHGFEGFNDEVELTRYVLKHGLAMKRINICCFSHRCDLKKKFRILQKIAMFPRVSPPVKSTFLEMNLMAWLIHLLDALRCNFEDSQPFGFSLSKTG